MLRPTQPSPKPAIGWLACYSLSTCLAFRSDRASPKLRNSVILHSQTHGLGQTQKAVGHCGQKEEPGSPKVREGTTDALGFLLREGGS